MGKTILITGGAGFIGSHCATLLLEHGYTVKALDNLDPQIHGKERRPPAYLDRRVELIVGDVRSPRIVRRALADVDAVIHLAARVGVGQSMYEVADYTDVNGRGTAVLLEAMIERAKRRPFDRLVVASSMSIYGEGLYRAADGSPVEAAERNPLQLKRGQWNPLDRAGRPLEAVPTPETKPPAVKSVYALSKYDQERLCLVVGEAYDIPTVALRFFNTYGPHQALSNPYTGVLAIFAARLLNGRPPLIFEDGEQRRDFVYVADIAEACRLALISDAAVGQLFQHRQRRGGVRSRKPPGFSVRRSGWRSSRKSPARAGSAMSVTVSRISRRRAPSSATGRRPRLPPGSKNWSAGLTGGSPSIGSAKPAPRWLARGLTL